jgi:integrase
MFFNNRNIEKLEPRETGYKVFDRSRTGLHLFVSPTGVKSWRVRYWLDGQARLYSLGQYPIIDVKTARKLTIEAKRMVACGKDPVVERRARRVAKCARVTFSKVALEWASKASVKWSDDYHKSMVSRIQRELIPSIGNRAIDEITAPEVLRLVRRIETRSTVVAHKTLQTASAVFRYAVASGLCRHDPASDLRGALTPAKTNHYPAITTPVEAGELIRRIDAFDGPPVVVAALRLAPLLFVRPGELRSMEWPEINLDAAEWRIPAEKTKMRDGHLVPLSCQAVAILRELQTATGQGSYVFPGSLGRPLAENALGAALRRIGYAKEETSVHGFRAMASTLLNEFGFSPDVIERQLGHAQRNKVRAAYCRAEYVEERRQMMQAWSDYLDSLKANSHVIAFRRTG